MLNTFREYANGAQGTVLELGSGARRRVALSYPLARRVVLLDVSAKKLTDAGAVVTATQRVCGDGARMPLRPGCFDAIVAAFTLCCVDDVDAVMLEADRLLRVGGRVFLLEHIRSRYSWCGAIQQAVTPLYSKIWNHCRLDRDPREHLNGRFSIDREELSPNIVPWLFLSCTKER